MAAVPTSSPFPITNLTRALPPSPVGSFQSWGLTGNLEKVLGAQYFAGKILIIGELWDQTPGFFFVAELQNIVFKELTRCGAVRVLVKS
jgi:hypothetical protein